MKKIIAYRWHTGRASIGVVVYQTNFDNFKAVMTTVDGFDQEKDLQHVADYGTKISFCTAVEAIKDGGHIEDITLWNQFQKECPETRVVLNAEDFKTLVTGGIVEKGRHKVILSDIGWDLMLQLIKEAQDG